MAVPKKTPAQTALKTIDKAVTRVEKIIEITNLTKVYDTTAVNDISLGIKKGEFVTLLGPSGCGKTTTLRMIAGFEKPTAGRVFLEGADVTSIPPHLRKVNTVFQRYALFPHLNVFNNIAFGLKLKKISYDATVYDKKLKETVKVEKLRKLTNAEIAEKVNRALKLVDLEDYGRRDTASLSGGQQQRVAIARALVNEPQVLLLDEPLGALDLKMRKEMQLELMRMHRDLKITFIYVTHDQEEALTMSDTIVVMNNGEIQQVGTPQQIYDEPSNAFVADFIGESNILSGVMIEDRKVKFTNTVFPCLDKGFDKNEPVDLVIRPEDIELAEPDDPRAQLAGPVTSSVFKGDYYEMQITANEYEFSVQVINGKPEGQRVGLIIAPNSIHIMKKLRIINEVKTEISGENTVYIEGGEFTHNCAGFSKGDRVKVRFPFSSVELTDYTEEGVISAKVTAALYKGSYYQVILRTEEGEYDIFVDTKYEYSIGDEVGVNIPAEALEIELMTEKEIKEEDEE